MVLCYSILTAQLLMKLGRKHQLKRNSDYFWNGTGLSSLKFESNDFQLMQIPEVQRDARRTPNVLITTTASCIIFGWFFDTACLQLRTSTKRIYSPALDNSNVASLSKFESRTFSAFRCAQMSFPHFAIKTHWALAGLLTLGPQTPPTSSE